MRHLWIGTFIVSMAGLGLGNASVAAAGPQSPQAQLKICANTCLSSAKGDDDRATCRLQCRNEFNEAKLAEARTTPPPKPVPRPAPAVSPPATLATPPAATPPASPAAAKVRWTAADLTRCQSVCDHEALSTDRATCRLQCKAKASEYSTATPTPRPPPRPNVGKAPQSGGYTPSGRLSAGGPMVFSPKQPSTAPAARRNHLEAEANQCRATCNRSAYRNNTDRETCKLTCNSKLDALPQGTVYHTQGTSAEAARRAVIESSNGVAGGHRSTPSYPAANYQAPPATPPAPPSMGKTKLTASPAPAQSCAAVSSCNRGCDNQQSLCTSSCTQENKRATDRATCKLTCTNNVEVCAEICASKVSMCQPKAAIK